MQSWRRSSGEQVRAVRRDMARKVKRVKAQAERVPRGMFLMRACIDVAMRVVGKYTQYGSIGTPLNF